MNKPLVSILIPCFNARRWIAQAVESALSQTWPNKEVIVIDDGSTDGSSGVLRDFGDRIRLVVRENRGGNPTRNELASLASGSWLQYLDADDYLLPDKVERQIKAALDGNGEPVDVIYSPVRIEYHDTADRRVEEPSEPVSGDPWVLHALWELTQTGGALFRRTALQEAGGWREDQPCCQDNELFFRLLKTGKRFRHCPGATAVYRRFATGTVSTTKREKVLRVMLGILKETEEFLRDNGMLTVERLNAINQHRFRQAKLIWPHDSRMADQIMRTVRQSQPGFRPAPGKYAPLGYRLIFAFGGFRMAQQAAACKRVLAMGNPRKWNNP